MSNNTETVVKKEELNIIMKNVATLDNWRKYPFAPWAFHNVRELIPTSEIENSPLNIWTLGSKYSSDILTDEKLRKLFVDAIVIVQDGKLVYEKYFNGMRPESQHILFSVSKSILGLIFGILEEDKVLDTRSIVSKYVPEICGTAYENATLRHCLDMQVGIYFDEDYLATSGPIVDYRYAANWNQTPDSKKHLGLHSFLKTLKRSDGSHGQKFHYVSPNTDLLGWVIERATGKKYSDLVSEVLWRPLGAERPGYITVDRYGAPRAAGGKCFTARDLARVGMLMYQNGATQNKQVIPERWIEDIFNGGSTEAWQLGDMASYFPKERVAYRSKWYSHQGSSPMVHGIGIHGQYLFVDRDRQLSISWFSSDNDPTSTERLPKVLNIVNQIRNQLS